MRPSKKTDKGEEAKTMPATVPTRRFHVRVAATKMNKQDTIESDN
jgi:hypothetical protein